MRRIAPETETGPKITTGTGHATGTEIEIGKGETETEIETGTGTGKETETEAGWTGGISMTLVPEITGDTYFLRPPTQRSRSGSRAACLPHLPVTRSNEQIERTASEVTACNVLADVLP